MTEILAQLTSIVGETAAAAVIVFIRVGAVMAMLPAFGERSVPARVRLVLALALTVIVFPAAPVSGALGFEDLIGFPLFSEVVAGLTLGLILRLTVFALQIAGTIVSQATSLSQLFGGGAVDAQPAMGHILFVAGLALAVSMGLHERVAIYILESYTYMPAGHVPSASDVTPLIISHVAKSFSTAFTFAAPFLIGSVVYNTALGVINRAMPQLMVAFVGAPAITLGGLILLFLTAPMLLQLWITYFLQILDSPLGV